MARVLILGGTAEAAELAARLAGDPRLETVTSLAGLTRLPNTAGRTRRGGFGGAEGLATFLKDERYDAVVDATHPFATQIARNAAEAANAANVPRVKLQRPPFERTASDRFVAVRNVEAAADAVPEGARVFLAAGRREVAPFAARRDLWCLVRMIEPPPTGMALPNGEVVLGRPPKDPNEEVALFEKHRIGWVVSKDSGGTAGAKIVAARRLGLPVVLIKRPPPPAGAAVASVEAVVEWIDATLFCGRGR
jgi:precorrin-6A/cobalt-precorrin-6A reductase